MPAVRPKKWLGQHFLKDVNIARKVVSYVNVKNNLLEIGPGMGVLTQFLIEKETALKVIEIDSESVAYLSKVYKLEKQIIEDDFLKYDLMHVFDGAPFSIVGNFPYNISSQILFKVLSFKHIIPELTGMFQKEVGKRICAEKGSKTYGILSVLIQAFYDTKYLFTVEPQVFSPPPKVKSAVIQLTRKNDHILPCDEKLFFTLVKAAFNQRRKTLRNALKSFSLTISINEDLKDKRAEQLSVSDFITLAQSVRDTT